MVSTIFSGSQHILCWKGLLQRQKGVHIGSLVLCTRAKKGRFHHSPVNITILKETIRKAIWETYTKAFEWLKHDHCHDTWIAGLIAVQAAEGHKKKLCENNPSLSSAYTKQQGMCVTPFPICSMAGLCPWSLYWTMKLMMARSSPASQH